MGQNPGGGCLNVALHEEHFAKDPSFLPPLHISSALTVIGEMASSGCNEAMKELEMKLLDVGKRLLNPPSSDDELHGLLMNAEHLLCDVYQSSPSSTEDALKPAKQALFADEIFKHADLKIQVAVASCFNELTRISSPEYPCCDKHMREIFQLFMVGLKQLSSESDLNKKRALRILKTLALIRSCLIMLDIEIDPMVVEMFQLFLDTISPNHSSDMFDHMKTVMILVIEESDEISMELLKPILSSVKMVNKNASPMSWELGKSVFENCATKLQGYVREAVKAMNLSVDDYAEIVASLCREAPIREDTVAYEEGASVHVSNKEDASVQFVISDASGDGASKLDGMSQAGPKMDIQVQRRKRGIKPNNLRRLEEGYEHAWLALAGGSGSSRAYCIDNKKDLLLPPELGNAKMPSDSSQKEPDSLKKVSSGTRGQSKKQESMMNQDNAQEVSSNPTKDMLQYKLKEKVSEKPKKTTEENIAGSSKVGMEKEQVDDSADDSERKDDNKTTSEKHESADVVDKVVESPTSKLAKARQSKVKEKGFNIRKKTSKKVVARFSAEKEKVKCNATNLDEKVENEIPLQKHESGDAADKGVEPSISKLVKAKQSKVKEKGSNIQRKMTQRVSHDSKEKDENEITSQKNEAGDAVDKVVESPMSETTNAKQTEVKGKGSNIQKKTAKRVFVESGSEKDRVDNSASDLRENDENEITSQKHEPGDAVHRVVESPMSKPAKAKQSKVKEKGFSIQKETTKIVIVGSSSTGGEKEELKHNAAHSKEKDENEITSQIHESGDVLDLTVISPMSEPAKAKQSKVKGKRTNTRKKTTKRVVAGSTTVGAEMEKVNHSIADSEGKDENEISFQKHESTDVVDKVVESPICNPAKAKYPRDLDLEKEKEKEPMDSCPEYGLELVNVRIMVWWPLDQTYYTGTVESFDPVTKKHKIKYDDDEEEVLDMSEERWELFTERQPRQMHSSHERVADHPSSADEAVKPKGEGNSLTKSGHSAPNPIPVKDESDDEMHEANIWTQEKTAKRKLGSSKKQHAGSPAKRSKGEGRSFRNSAPDPVPAKDELGETFVANSWIHETTTKRKGSSSKRQHAGASTKRSRSDGHSLMKSGHSAADPTPVKNESDDETCEASFSPSERVVQARKIRKLRIKMQKPSHGNSKGSKSG